MITLCSISTYKPGTRSKLVGGEYHEDVGVDQILSSAVQESEYRPTRLLWPYGELANWSDAFPRIVQRPKYWLACGCEKCLPALA